MLGYVQCHRLVLRTVYSSLTQRARSAGLTTSDRAVATYCAQPRVSSSTSVD